MRTLALVLDYGFVGARGQDELTRLLADAARSVAARGIEGFAFTQTQPGPTNAPDLEGEDQDEVEEEDDDEDADEVQAGAEDDEQPEEVQPPRARRGGTRRTA